MKYELERVIFIITKKFGVDFDSGGYSALTLGVDDLGTHEDGWTITGDIVNEGKIWVSDFEATHPIYGKVWGDFQTEVFADSEEGFEHFYENHPPDVWNYQDL